MLKAYKYRLYPTGTQKEFIAKTFGCSRLVWNLMLAEKLNAYQNKKNILQITPAKYKTEYQFLKEVDSLALADTQLHLEKALTNHFKKKGHFGLPKFKKRKDKHSYTTNNQNSTVRVENNCLYVPKLKSGIKIKLHRAFDGARKSTTISKTPSDKYYVSILLETDNTTNNTANLSKACGIDLGLSSFAAVTNDLGSYKIDHPHYLKKAEKKLIRLLL
jgi:putative transposase